jgi:hypothetical protein
VPGSAQPVQHPRLRHLLPATRARAALGAQPILRTLAPPPPPRTARFLAPPPPAPPRAPPSRPGHWCARGGGPSHRYAPRPAGGFPSRGTPRRWTPPHPQKNHAHTSPILPHPTALPACTACGPILRCSTRLGRETQSYWCVVVSRSGPRSGAPRAPGGAVHT